LVGGKTIVSQNTSEGYEVTQNGSNFYSWIVEEGTILSGNGTNSIQVYWDDQTNPTGKVKVVEISNFGCAGDTVELIISKKSTGISGINKPQILLYPNPATNKVAIITGGQKINKLLCYDVLGKATALQVGEDNIFTTETLAQGLYIVEVHTEAGEVFTTKLIKQ
jgi:hypothetical protein